MGSVQSATWTEDRAATLLRWAPALIERHMRYAADDLTEVQRHLQSLHDSISLKVENPEEFINYREVLLRIGNLVMTVGCVNSERGYELGFQSFDDYMITIPMRGSGWASTGDLFVEYGHDDIMIVAPSCTVVKHWYGPGEVLTLHVPAVRFDKVRADLNIPITPIAPIATIDAWRLRSFLRIVDVICRDLKDQASTSPFLRDPLADQVEVMLLTLLLHQWPAVETPGLATGKISPAVPYYIRRAEEFMSANGNRDIGIEQIAAASGVSARTIQYGFRKYRDMTPMLFLKHLRYERARAMLLPGDHPRRKINEVAAEIGCANISQFSRDYRALFGETPSHTVATSRRLLY